MYLRYLWNKCQTDSLSTQIRRTTLRDSCREYLEHLESRCLLSATLNALDGTSLHEAAQVVQEVSWRGQALSAYQDSWLVSTQVFSEAEGWLWSLSSGLDDTLDAGSGTRIVDAEALGQGFFEIQMADDADATQLRHRFDGLLGLNYVEPNFELSASLLPDDPVFGDLWALNNTGQTGGTPDADIDALEAWDVHTGDGQVIVAVIDSGVDYNHPDLIDNIWVNPGEIAGDGIDNDGNGYIDDVHGYDFVNDDSDPMDDHSHGTHVAGTIGATGFNQTGVIGVNPDVQIMALKFLNDKGNGSSANAIKAINYLTTMKRDYGIDIRLSNNSWGGGSASQAMRDAIASNLEQDILFVAAAGNKGLDNDEKAHYPSNYELDNVIAVAATDHDDLLAGFSNFGNMTVDLAAPGVSIASTTPGGGYGYKSGTSMATPQVSGALSLLLSANPELSGQDAKTILLETVDPLPQLSGEVATGGRLNVYNMLTDIRAIESSMMLVTNGNDNGAGSLRSAIEVANLVSDVTTIRILSSVNRIELERALTYTGSQSLAIEGGGASLKPVAAQTGFIDLFISESAANMTLTNMTIENGRNGLTVNVPASATGNVSLFLGSVLVQNNHRYGVHLNDALFDSDAGVQFLAHTSQFTGNGIGINGYAGVRIDEGGLGGARADIIHSAFVLNGGGGLAVNEADDGLGALIVDNGFFFQNGYADPLAYGDGLSFEEAGDGDVFIQINQAVFDQNAAMGINVFESGQGTLALNLINGSAAFNHDDGMNFQESDSGDFYASLQLVQSNQSFQGSGIALSESGLGLLQLNAADITVIGNTLAGLRMTESDEGHLYAIMERISAQFNGGDGLFLEEHGAGDLLGAMIDLTTVGNGGYGINLIQDQVAGDRGQLALYYLPYLNTSGSISAANVAVTP